MKRLLEAGALTWLLGGGVVLFIILFVVLGKC